MTAIDPPSPSQWPADDEVDAVIEELEEALASDEAGEIVDGDQPPDTPFMELEREILPQWLRYPRVGVGMAKRRLHKLGGDMAFHGVRAPLYWLWFAWWAVLTLGRVAEMVAQFLYHPDSRADLVTARVQASEIKSMAQVEKHRDARRNQLWFRVALFGVGVLAAWFFVASRWLAASVPLKLLSFVLAVPALGWWSRPVAEDGADGGILAKRTRAFTLSPVTSEGIATALDACGIEKLSRAIQLKGPDAIGFIHRIQRNAADTATTTTVSLPAGITATMVMDRTMQLASALERPPECVMLANLKGKPANWLEIYISDQPLSDMAAVKWTLASKGKTNVFSQFPVGEDQRGRPISIGLFESSVLVAALQGFGKTALSLLITGGVCLDPRVELHIWDCKGGGDWRAFRRVAHSYGASPSMLDIGVPMLNDLRAIEREMNRRYAILGGLPEDEVPENKINDDLADRLGLRPILVVLDESQSAFNKRPFTLADVTPVLSGVDIAESVENLIRKGRAVGIIIVLITQKPSATSIPTDIRDLITMRFCGRVTKVSMQQMVLGDHYAGPSPLSLGMNDRGTWVLAGETDEGILVRTPYLNANAVKALVERIYTAKKAAGLLTGQAAGDETGDEEPVDTSTVLEDLVNWWPADRKTLRTEEVAGLLSGQDPYTYPSWTAAQVTMALSVFGIKTDPKYIDDGSKQTRRAVKLSDLETALVQRQRADGGSSMLPVLAEVEDEEPGDWSYSEGDVVDDEDVEAA